MGIYLKRLVTQGVRCNTIGLVPSRSLTHRLRGAMQQSYRTRNGRADGPCSCGCFRPDGPKPARRTPESAPGRGKIIFIHVCPKGLDAALGDRPGPGVAPGGGTWAVTRE